MKAGHVGLWVLGLGLVLPTACGRDALLAPGGLDASAAAGGRGGGTGASSGQGGGAGGRGGAGGGGADAGDAGAAEVRPGEFPLVVLPDLPPALPVGKSFRFRALVKLGPTDASWRDLAADPLLIWAIDDSSIAEITPKNGRVTGGHAGKTVVRASHPTFGLAQAPLVVTTSALARVSVQAAQPGPLALMIGQTQLLTATATYGDGSSADVTQAATWATADQRVVLVENSLPPIGQVTGQATGSTTISADFAGVRAEIAAVVSGTAPPTLSVAPISASQIVGATARFNAIFRQATAPNSDVSAVATWTSSDPAVAMWLGPSGQFRCLAVGTTTVSASYKDLTASAPLSCTMGAPTLRELRLSLPNNGPLIVGVSYGLGLEAIASDGMATQVSDGKLVSWSSSDLHIATIDGNPAVPSPTFIATLIGLGPGVVTVTATFRGVSISQDYTFIAR
jgi:uncharacterized protein YjdB